MDVVTASMTKKYKVMDERYIRAMCSKVRPCLARFIMAKVLYIDYLVRMVL